MCVSIDMTIVMKQNVQLEPPALLGRRQRIQEFTEYVKANRKELTANKIVARYALQSGVADRTIAGYLKLFYEAGIYVKPNFRTRGMILTPKEYKAILPSDA